MTDRDGRCIFVRRADPDLGSDGPTVCDNPGVRRVIRGVSLGPFCDDHMGVFKRIEIAGRRREDLIRAVYSWAVGDATDDDLRKAVELDLKAQSLRRQDRVRPRSSPRTKRDISAAS